MSPTYCCACGNFACGCPHSLRGVPRIRHCAPVGNCCLFCGCLSLVRCVTNSILTPRSKQTGRFETLAFRNSKERRPPQKRSRGKSPSAWKRWKRWRKGGLIHCWYVLSARCCVLVLFCADSGIVVVVVVVQLRLFAVVLEVVVGPVVDSSCCGAYASLCVRRRTD